MRSTFVRKISFISGVFRRYCLETGAAAAIVFALMVPAVVGAVGLSVDLARAYLAKERLSHALDAAALAAGSSTNLTGPELEARATAFLNKNYSLSAEGVLFDIQIEEVGGKLKMSASASLDTLFMGLLGIEVVNVHASSEVTRSVGKDIELSLVLDISGSMAGQRIVDLKEGAKALIDTVVQSNQSAHPYSKVALIPYSMAVNVGSTYASSVRGTITSGTSATPGRTNFTFTNPSGSSRTFAVSTCVTERTGDHAFTDAAPSTSFLGRNYPSSANPCLGSRIVPLTTNKTTLKSSIDSLVASGSTGGHIGVAWGWYMISPNFSYLWPAASRPANYGTEKLQKIVVLMTDGEYNSPYCKGVIAKDATNGSGSVSDHINCNSPNGSSYYQAEQLCEAMKQDNQIEVYTIGFDIIDTQAAVDLMRNCATDLSHFYTPNNGTELKQAFQDIADKVKDLYISQ